MKTIPALVLSLAILPIWTVAATEPAPFNLITSEGKTYERARVLAVDPDGLRITHASGAAKIDYELLSPEVQKEFGFSAAKAKAFRETREKELAEAQASRLRAEIEMQQEKENAAFKLFRDRIMATITSWNYNFVELDGLIAEWIAAYKKAGRDEWAAALEKDREFLRNQEKERPLRELAERTKALEDENHRLAQELDALRQGQRVETRTLDTVSYVESPYWYSNYNLPLIVPTPYPLPVARPRPCPPAARPSQDLAPSPAFKFEPRQHTTIRPRASTASVGAASPSIPTVQAPALPALQPQPGSGSMPSAGRTIPSADGRTMIGPVNPGMRHGR